MTTTVALLRAAADDLRRCAELLHGHTHHPAEGCRCPERAQRAADLERLADITERSSHDVAAFPAAAKNMYWREHVHDDDCLLAGCLACVEPERYDDHTCVS